MEKDRKCVNSNCDNRVKISNACCFSGERHNGHLREARQKMRDEYRKRTGDEGV